MEIAEEAYYEKEYDEDISVPAGLQDSSADSAAEVGLKAEPKADPQVSAQLKGSVKYLSADDSNSMASPVIARKMIMSGKYVQPALIRTYEFLNYYSFSYPAPVDDPISIIPEMRPGPEEGAYSLQVAVRGLDRRMEDLPPFNITFLLDVSGSMAGEPIELAKAFILGFVDIMRDGDLLSIVTCNRRASVLLDSQTVNESFRRQLERILGQIRVNDITDLERGILEAYKLAGKNYNYRYLNRVILISDGAANAGAAALDTITRHAEDSDRQGIYLAGIGLGEGFNDRLMDSFTDKGRGAYLFLDSPLEIERILDRHHFAANFDIAVKNVRLKMIMPAGWTM